MKKWLCCLLLIFTLLPASADSSAYVLYSLDADIDGDGVAERLLILSYQSSDPARMGPKTLKVLQQKGDTYRELFSDDFEAGFSTKVAPFQWEGVDNAMAGLALRRYQGQKYPGLWIVFTPNSSDLLSYTFDGKTFIRDELPDGI